MLGSLFLSNSLHIKLYFEATLCITVTYYFEIKVTSNILQAIINKIKNLIKEVARDHNKK